MKKVVFGVNKYACCKYYGKLRNNKNITFRMMAMTKDGWTIFYEKN